MPPPAIQPEWVMIGVAHEDRVELYASRTLSSADLQVIKREEYDISDLLTSVRWPNRYQLVAIFDDFVFIVGETWAEAFDTLHNVWSPAGREPARKPREISSRPAIESRVEGDTA